MTPRMPIGWSDFPTQQAQPQGGFVWGQGGARLSPEQLQRQQAAAQSQMRPDFSPVEGGVLGALARGAGNIYGAVQSNNLGKQEAAAGQDRSMQIAALLGGGGGNLAGALASNDPVVSALAADAYKAQLPKTATPDAFDRALQGAGIDPSSTEGVNLFRQRAATLALPAPQMIGSPETGYQFVQPPSPFSNQGGGGPASMGQGAPPAMLPPDFDFGDGGPTQPASGGFSAPSGSPLDPFSR